MPRKAKQKEVVKVFHICRYEQWFELPASSGYCTAGPLKFFRFFVSGSDPSAKEFHERVDRLSRHGDQHQLLGVYTRLVTWASMQPRTHRGYLLDIDNNSKPMTFEDLAWKLDVKVEECTAFLAALTHSRLIENIDMPTVWGSDEDPTTAPAESGNKPRAQRKSGPAGKSKKKRSKSKRSASAAPQRTAEHSGVPDIPVIGNGNDKPKRVTVSPCGDNKQRVTEEPERPVGLKGPLRGPGRENPEPDAQGQREPNRVTQGQETPQRESEAKGQGVTPNLGMEAPTGGDTQTRFHPPSAAARGCAGSRYSRPPGPSDTLTKPGQFAVEMFNLIECPYHPKSQQGLSELASFANGWRKAETMIHSPNELNDLWESMVDEALKIAKQRKNPRKHFRKSPEAKLMYLFKLKMNKRACSPGACAG